MPNVTSEDNETCVSSPANVTLQCSWSSPSYYVAWYKDGGLIYSEDLSVPNVLMQASDGFVVESSYISRTSTLTILSSSIDDSGNYTCAVSRASTSTTVTTSNEMIEVTDLASCTEYSATLMASNKVNTGPSTTVNLTTTETGICSYV